MKVFAIFDFYPPHVGGAEAVYGNVCEGLVRRGHSITVLTNKEGALSQEGLQGGVIVKKVYSWGRMLFPFFGLSKAVGEAKKADVLLTSLYSSSILTLIVKVLCRKKAYIIVHEYIGKRWFSLGFSWPRAFLLYISEWLALFPLYDGYICVSESTKTYLSKKIRNQEKLHVIYNGLDHVTFSPRGVNMELRRKYGIPMDKKVMMFAGRPGYFKGLGVLLEALTIVQKKDELSFHMVLMLSKRPQEKYTEAMNYIDEHGLAKDITILDSVPRADVADHFSMADVGVVPSQTEGFGFSAAEFCSMEIPVVISNVDSLPEVVSGRVVFTQAGSSESLASALCDASMGKYTSRPRKEFSWLQSVVEYERIMNQCSK